MEGELFYKTAFCSKYERLLCVCVQSLNTWRNLREEIANSVLRSKEVGDELMPHARGLCQGILAPGKAQRQLRTRPVRLEISGRNDTSLSIAVIENGDCV